MAALAEYKPSLLNPGLFPHLIDAETTGLLKIDPVTVTDLLAASQHLRGRPEYKISITDNKLHFSNGGTKYTLEAVQVLDATTRQVGISYPIVWGATVEGEIHAQDIIEPHIIVPPNTDNLAFRLKWLNDNNIHDVQVLGAFDGKDGKEPIAGETNKIRGQVGRGSKGEVLIFRYEGNSNTASGFNVQPATQAGPDGRTVLIPADSFENLSDGGFDLVVIPGTISSSTPPILFYPAQSDNNYRLRDLAWRDSGFDVIRMDIPQTYAATVSAGREFGESGTAAFENMLNLALAVKFRIRINSEIPPLEGTKGYVAWLNNQREQGNAYQSIVCTYCGHQALHEQASLDDGTLHVHKNCLCGARKFEVVEYLTTRTH